MPPPDDVAVVITDLQDSHHALEASRGSPKEVRRQFSRYAELSQRLTAVMRRQYSEQHGKKWTASLFTGWTADTALLKYVRNQDQHSLQVQVSVEQLQYFSLSKQFGMVLPDGDDLVLTSSYHVDHQLLEANPTGMVLSRNSTLNDEPPGPLVPVRVEWRYFLLPRSEEERALFESASSKDVHHVVKSAHASLTAYHGFFRSSSGA